LPDMPTGHNGALCCAVLVRIEAQKCYTAY
jgi:hypothetical protein